MTPYFFNRFVDLVQSVSDHLSIIVSDGGHIVNFQATCYGIKADAFIWKTNGTFERYFIDITDIESVIESGDWCDCTGTVYGF